MLHMKLNEKELLNGLNSRMVAYIDKVRYLEEQNQILEEKIAEAKSKRTSVLTDAMKEELIQLRKDIDDANMVRFDLETKIETLREEIDYQKKMHEEEIEELKAQIREQGYNIEVDDISPDISEMLRQIRAQYEQMVIKNRDETESWYKSKFEDLDSKAKVNAAE